MISLTAHLEPDPNVRSPRRGYKLVVLDRFREPLPGATVDLVLAQDGGTFDSHDPTRLRLEVTADDAGEAFFDWYRPGGDATHAGTQLRLTCNDERAIDITVEPQIEMPWI